MSWDNLTYYLSCWSTLADLTPDSADLDELLHKYLDDDGWDDVIGRARIKIAAHLKDAIKELREGGVIAKPCDDWGADSAIEFLGRASMLWTLDDVMDGEGWDPKDQLCYLLDVCEREHKRLTAEVEP